MIYTPLKEQIDSELENYSKEVLPINQDYAPNQGAILDLIDYYWMDKFRDGSTTREGWKKAFYNIVCHPTLVSQKMVDLDTKDIRVVAAEGASYYPSWFFSRDLNLYMRLKNWASFLNEVVYKLPKYGSVMVKKVGNDVMIVPLRNLVMDQNVNDLHEMSHILEKHEYWPGQLRKFKQYGWDEGAIEEAITKANGQKICVYERFGELASSLSYNYHIATKDGILLSKDTYDDVDELYRKLDWEAIEGRTLGRGQVERLFEAQIQNNRVANFKTEGLHWSSKHIFQTRDATVTKNLLNDVDNGQVLVVNSEITPVANEERNLAAYREEEQRWDSLINAVTFAYDEISGERPPAGTPLGTSLLQTNQASGYFDGKREDIGIFLKEIILDWVIPSFKSENYSQHQLMLSEFDDDQLTRLREMFTNQKANADLIRYITREGNIPDQETEQLIRSVAAETVSKERDITIPAGFYNDVKYKVDVIITNEQVDVSARLTTLQTALQLLASNPAIVQNPSTKKIFFKLLDLSGISPVDLGINDGQPSSIQDTLATFPQRGGSLARPTPSLLPVQGAGTTTA